MLVLELARSDYIERRENIIAVGNSGTGKSHVALGLGFLLPKQMLYQAELRPDMASGRCAGFVLTGQALSLSNA